MLWLHKRRVACFDVHEKYADVSKGMRCTSLDVRVLQVGVVEQGCHSNSHNPASRRIGLERKVQQHSDQALPVSGERQLHSRQAVPARRG